MVWRRMGVFWAPPRHGCQGQPLAGVPHPNHKPYKCDPVPAGRQLPGRLLACKHRFALIIAGCCDGVQARAAAGRAGLLGPLRGADARGIPESTCVGACAFWQCIFTFPLPRGFDCASHFAALQRRAPACGGRASASGVGAFDCCRHGRMLEIPPGVSV